MVEIARESFVSGMQLTAGIAAVVALGIAVLTLRTLRQVPSGNEREAAQPEPAAQTDPGAAAGELVDAKAS